jgi:hypothetical protein
MAGCDVMQGWQGGDRLTVGSFCEQGKPGCPCEDEDEDGRGGITNKEKTAGLFLCRVRVCPGARCCLYLRIEMGQDSVFYARLVESGEVIG